MALDRTLVDDAFTRELHAVAGRLRTSPDNLLRVMRFESGLDPQARNPRSGATGLIQFLPSTARGLGTTTEALARMTPTEQLAYVERYLQPYTGKLHDVGDLYMAVFSPRGIGKSADTVLYSRQRDAKAYEHNKALDRTDKGYITRDDAVQAVTRTRGNGTPAPAPSFQMRVPTSGLRPAAAVAKSSAQTEDADGAGIDWSGALFQPTDAPRRPSAGRTAEPVSDTPAPTPRPLAPLEVPAPLTPAQGGQTPGVAAGETDWSAALFG